MTMRSRTASPNWLDLCVARSVREKDRMEAEGEGPGPMDFVSGRLTPQSSDRYRIRPKLWNRPISTDRPISIQQ